MYSLRSFDNFIASDAQTWDLQTWNLIDSTLTSREGYVLVVRNGWDPDKIGSNLVIEIEEVIGINKQTMMVEEQDRSNSNDEQVWTVTQSKVAGHYKFSIGLKFLTTDSSKLSLYTLGNCLNIF